MRVKQKINGIVVACPAGGSIVLTDAVRARQGRVRVRKEWSKRGWCFNMQSMQLKGKS